MKSATIRYCGSGLISHGICNHELLWLWCNISQNLKLSDISIIVKYLISAENTIYCYNSLSSCSGKSGPGGWWQEMREKPTWPARKRRRIKFPTDADDQGRRTKEFICPRDFLTPFKYPSSQGHSKSIIKNPSEQSHIIWNCRTSWTIIQQKWSM